MEDELLQPSSQPLTGALAGLDYRHLRTLTDGTGILQHARYCIPDRDHGYCVDDNARALIVACWGSGLGDDLAGAASIYLAFINHAYNRENGRFRNFMSYDRRWLEDAGSEDSHGRSLWGLAVAAVSAPYSSQRIIAERLFTEGLAAVRGFEAPRARAFTMLGLDQYLRGNEKAGGAHELLQELATGLYDLFLCNGEKGWLWCEGYVTYANAVLPLSLLLAGRRLGDAGMKEMALRALRWLVERQTAGDGHISIIGNDGWMTRAGHRARFDQQPLDAAALLLACIEAYIATGDMVWLEDARRAYAWFVGENDLGLSLFDPETGGCCDGLHRDGVNFNQGAESTLAWLLARLGMERLMVMNGDG